VHSQFHVTCISQLGLQLLLQLHSHRYVLPGQWTPYDYECNRLMPPPVCIQGGHKTISAETAIFPFLVVDCCCSCCTFIELAVVLASALKLPVFIDVLIDCGRQLLLAGLLSKTRFGVESSMLLLSQLSRYWHFSFSAGLLLFVVVQQCILKSNTSSELS